MHQRLLNNFLKVFIAISIAYITLPISSILGEDDLDVVHGIIARCADLEDMDYSNYPPYVEAGEMYLNDPGSRVSTFYGIINARCRDDGMLLFESHCSIDASLLLYWDACKVVFFIPVGEALVSNNNLNDPHYLMSHYEHEELKPLSYNIYGVLRDEGSLWGSNVPDLDTGDYYCLVAASASERRGESDTTYEWGIGNSPSDKNNYFYYSEKERNKFICRIVSVGREVSKPPVTRAKSDILEKNRHAGHCVQYAICLLFLCLGAVLILLMFITAKWNSNSLRDDKNA